MTQVQANKFRYLSILIIYFCTGLFGITAVSNIYFIKNHISLSGPELISVGIFVSLPWSIKMVFGSLIDSVPLFGNNRKSYIYLGLFLSLIGVLGNVDHASTRYIINYLNSEYLGLILTGAIGTVGIVLCDIIADILAIELVSSYKTGAIITEYEQELASVQLYSRISLAGGAVIASSLTGLVATLFSPAVVFALQIIPILIILIVIYFINIPVKTEILKANKLVLIGGLIYGALAIYLGLTDNMVLLFFVSLFLLIILFIPLIKKLPESARNIFIMAMLGMFLFRLGPGIGPGLEWFYITELKFSAEFMGYLNLISNIAGILTLIGLGKLLTKMSIYRLFLWLTILYFFLSLPDILIFYKVNELIGISPKLMVLSDTGFMAALGQISMLPLGIITARYAPATERAVYISLTASLMNLSLLGGDLITQKLNQLLIVTRTDFTQLGHLLISSLAINILLCVIALLIFKRFK